MKEKMHQANYEYIGYLLNGEGHLLLNLVTGIKEVWVANKNHASYGLIYKNTHLEFVREY